MSQSDSPNTFDVLRSVVERVQCKPGWKFRVVEEEGALRLRITDTKCVNSYSEPPNYERMPLNHFFPVPTATYNERTWLEWVFSCCRGVENHELGEWFRFGDERPFAPLHGPGENPYVVHSFRDPADAEITQDGTVVPMDER